MDLKRGTAILQLLLLSLHSGLASEPCTSPQFTTQPSDVIVAPSGTAVLECGASGSPQPAITWYKDDSQVTLDVRIVQGASGNLQISDVQNSDASRYHCIASNAAGSVRSQTAALTIAFINAVPSTVSNQEPMLTRENDGLVLDCHVPTSLPEATVTWSRRGVTLEENLLTDRLGVTLDGRLVFSAFRGSSDTGLFSCEVENDVVSTMPMASSSYLLSLLVGDATAFIETEFVAIPTSQTVVAGMTAEFECFTTGSPVATFTWQKDGASLSASGRLSFQQGKRILTIQDVSASDGGSYTCIATQSTNMGPNTEEVSASLTVIEPPTITESFPQTSVFVTQPASLTCRAPQGTTPLSWIWRLNGQDIPTSARVEFDTQGAESTLTISSVQEADEGVYQCVVENQGGVATANELLVAQTSPPTFTHGSELQDTLVFVDATVMLPCTAEGFPPPTFSWIMGTQEVNLPQDRYSLPPAGTGDGTLTITSSVQGDSAIYKCRASNSINSMTTSPVQLRVIAHPPVISSPETQVPNPGDTVVLLCAVSTPADITVGYSWTKDGSPLTPTSRITVASGNGDLTIMNIGNSDNGNYECTVRLSVSGLGATPLSEVVGSAIVTVGDPPVPPSPPFNPAITMATTITAQSASAQWTPPTSDGGLQLTSYIIEILNMGSSDCPQAEPEWEPISTVVPHTDTLVVATVESLQPHSRYQFRVVAINSGGLMSEPSVPSSTFQTLQTAPSAPPTSISVAPAGEGQLMVSWAPPTNCSTHNGILTDYTLRYRVAGGNDAQELPTGGATSHLLTDLLPSTAYEVQVAAHTGEGRGPFSPVVMETTAEEGTPEEGTPEEGTPPSPSPSPTSPSTGPQGTSSALKFYQEVWFIVVVVVGGVLGLAVLVTIIAFICCCKCDSKEGKIYITSRRSNSSLSGASSGFSEYQHKHKVMSRFVRVHSSPTPSRRTQDYADLESFRSGRSQPNGAPPSLSYPDSLMSAGMESQDHYPPNLEMHRGTPFSMQAQFDPTTPLPAINSQDGYDHMPMSHMINGTGPVTLATMAQLPPPPPNFVPPDSSTTTHSSPSPPPLSQPSGRGKGLSQDSEDSWSPADYLNYRGHMTGREPSMTSATSVTSVESNGGNDPRPPSKTVATKSWEHRAPNQAGGLEPGPSTSRQNSVQNGRSPLPPLQEHRSMEGGLDDPEGYNLYSVPSKHRIQPNSVHQQSRSLEQRKQNKVQDSPPRYNSLSPKLGMEMEHHVQQAPIPSSLSGLGMRQGHRQHSVPNSDPMRYPQRPPFHDRSLSQPQSMQHRHAHTNIHNPRTPSPQDMPDMGPRQAYSYDGSHHRGMEHRQPGKPMQNGIQHRQPSVERELDPRVAHNIARQQLQDDTRGYPIPRTDVTSNRMYPIPEIGSNPGPNFIDSRQQQQHDFVQNFDSRQPLPQHGVYMSMPHLEPRSRGVHHPPAHSNVPNMQLGYGIPEQRSQPVLYRPPETQGGPPMDYYHDNLEKVEHPNYPDVISNSTNSNGHLGLAPPPETIPDLGQIDVRRPKLRKTKVPREVWEPRPMNRAVESSSESDDNYSESSFGAGDGDNTSLKSSHV